MNFAKLGLIEPLLRATEALGYQTPSPVQAEAIPAVLKGRDLMAAAQTGTGKTAGFALPVLQRLALEGEKVASNSIRALVLVPTRELAEQVHNNVREYAENLVKGFRDKPVVDFVHEYAFPFPGYAGFSLLGFPDSDTETLKEWSRTRVLLTYGRLSEEARP